MITPVQTRPVNQGQGSLATAVERYTDGSSRERTRLVRQRETQVGSSACFTIEWRVNHIFCCTSSPVLASVNAQVPASINVVESMRGINCVYLVYMHYKPVVFANLLHTIW